MDEQYILKKLKTFKSIKPDNKYSEKSRMLILSATADHQKADFKTPFYSFKNFIEILRTSTVVGFVAFLLLFFMGGISYINKNFSPLGLEGLSQKSLVTEAEEINNSIQITLEQIKYLDQSNKKTINSINEVSNNKPVYETSATMPEEQSKQPTETESMSQNGIITNNTEDTGNIGKNSTSTENIGNTESMDNIEDFLINASSTESNESDNTDKLLEEISK